MKITGPSTLLTLVLLCSYTSVYAEGGAHSSVCAELLEGRLPTANWNQEGLKFEDDQRRLSDARANHPLMGEWLKAQAQLTRMNETVSSFSALEQTYFQPILSGIRAALTRHQMEYLRAQTLKGMDVPRHVAILRAIAAFDEKQPRFSLYKVKRAIEGRYSLSEYANCIPQNK